MQENIVELLYKIKTIESEQVKRRGSQRLLDYNAIKNFIGIMTVKAV